MCKMYCIEYWGPNVQARRGGPTT